MLMERRRASRFAMQLPSRLKQGDISSDGITVNVSSTGALIQTDARFRPGVSVEVQVQWPVSLEECDLKLVLAGVVVWTRENLTAIRTTRHEFRTVSREKKSASSHNWTEPQN